jgi:hypothetical protein
LHTGFPAHHFYQSPGDGQPKAGTTILAGGRGVGPAQRQRNRLGDLVRADANARIHHLEAHQNLFAALFEQAGTQSDGTTLGELDGVAGVVEQGLPQPGRVAAQPKWDAARVDFDGQALGTGLIADHRANVVDHRPQREVGLFQFEFAGLDLGDVEDVVDHRQEVTGRTVDLAQSFGLLGPWLAPAQQMRETDDGVHRRADFVAHVGQETAFRQVGGFCGGFGCSPVRWCARSPIPRDGRGDREAPPRHAVVPALLPLVR